MKMLIIMVGLIFAFNHMEAQTMDAIAKKTDFAAQKVIGYLKNKKADSIYLMTGKSFQQKITRENFDAITNARIFPSNNFEKVVFVSSTDGINKYRVSGEPALQLLIGLDTDNKIGTLLIQPFQP